MSGKPNEHGPLNRPLTRSRHCGTTLSPIGGEGRVRGQRATGRFMGRLLSLSHMHWDPEPHGPPNVGQASRLPSERVSASKVPLSAVQTGGRRDACPTFRFMGRGRTSNLQEDLAPIHPEKDEPQEKQHRHPMHERFISVAEHLEGARPKMGPERLSNKSVEQMRDAVRRD